ncbi:hypothetical protein NDU88_003270 [Pleurodeles waltl]|uniref:Uncharacterized protein n=1 Tax=Pleurodeles waltl TaxID=8319 RepID=A0AAV7KY20_PLEWA|nr:hypothetical protein NDU88_003270 [Pleurodeles waltl]
MGKAAQQKPEQTGTGVGMDPNTRYADEAQSGKCSRKQRKPEKPRTGVRMDLNTRHAGEAQSGGAKRASDWGRSLNNYAFQGGVEARGVLRAAVSPHADAHFFSRRCRSLCSNRMER